MRDNVRHRIGNVVESVGGEESTDRGQMFEGGEGRGGDNGITTQAG